MQGDGDARRLAWALTLGFALIYLAFLPPGIYSVDGNSMLAVAESLVTHNSIAVPSSALGTLGPDGHVYSNWYPLLSFLAAPLVAIAVPISRSFHVPLHYVAGVLASVLPALLTAATVGLVARIAVQLGSTLQGARRAALAFALGTIAMVYARTFYAEPLLALLITGAVYFASRDTKLLSTFAGGTFSALSLLAKPTGIVLGPLLAAYLFVKRRSLKEFIIPAAGSVVGFALYGAYNFTRFGNPLNFGQPFMFSFANIPAGFAGLLFSPGRGIIWYCPAVIMGVLGFQKVAKRKRPEALLIAGLFGSFLLLHSLWTFWHGGWSWGPRFLVPVLPGILALTGLLENKGAKWLLVLAFVGFLVNAPTLISYYERYYAEATERGIPENAILWSPAQAPFLHAWGAAFRVIADARKNDVREMFRETGTPSTTIASSRALRVIAVWWWVLPVVHIPRIVGATISIIMVLLGGWIISRVRLPDHPASFTETQSHL